MNLHLTRLLQRLALPRETFVATTRLALFAIATFALMLAGEGRGLDQSPAADDTKVSRAEQLFVLKLKPLLQQRCAGCHSRVLNNTDSTNNTDNTETAAQLDLLTPAGWDQGGDSGESLVNRDEPSTSLLLRALRWEDFEMPPKANDRLSDEQISAFESWIEAGAPWPNEERTAMILTAERQTIETADGLLVDSRPGQNDSWTFRRYPSEQLWAFRPLLSDLPESNLSDSNWDWESESPDSIHPIDQFFARNEEPPFAPRADRRTLIRRATFDLIGLPPTPAEIEAFVTDPADDRTAFSTVIERLLESPHYGEQLGRHWLDVTRYADSAGFANDYERGNAWRYRDYVVRAFNHDKPFNEFVIEQIAGDEYRPDDPEALIAVGFLRMGPWELTGMEVPRIARQRFLDDVTDSVGQVFLGQMLQCARCHDHKFDPISTRDYYAMQAAFATTQFAEREVPFLDSENQIGFDQRKYLEQRRVWYQQLLDRLNTKSIEAARAWYAAQQIDSAMFEDLVAKNINYNNIRYQLQNQGLNESQVPPRHVGFEPLDFGLERVANKGLERLKFSLERYEPFALSVYSGATPEWNSVSSPLRMPESPHSGKVETTHVLTGGDPFAPAELVSPGVLVVAAAQAAPPSALTQAFPVQVDITSDTVNRRLELAQWIASPDNPLTARVIVNRIWLWHFGRPLAGNPNNFGATGGRPAHPELLDQLASRFIADGWSIKQLHRHIMHSETYARTSHRASTEHSSHSNPDPNSYAQFQPRRLDSQELYDAILAVSGELHPTVGGAPSCPEINLEVAHQPRMVMGTFAEAWQASPQPALRHRRSIYTLKLRGLLDPWHEVFNSPTPDLSCERRESSTVTPQVFSLFNNPNMMSRSLAMAKRLHAFELDEPGTIARAFELSLGRPPTEQESATFVAHWRAMTARHRELQFNPDSQLLSIRRRAIEENTGETFEYDEPLESAADFEPDAQLADASPELRGLAEVCLVLFNSNEFLYLD